MRWLDRNGLVKRARNRAQGTPLSAGTAPNALGCADFKGEFKLGNGRYCYPLTVSDHASRYLLLCEACESTREAPVIRPGFEPQKSESLQGPPVIIFRSPERRRAQLRVARRVLDRSMAKPILDAACVSTVECDRVQCRSDLPDVLQIVVIVKTHGSSPCPPRRALGTPARTDFLSFAAA
jgi:hypothetical protein